MKSNNDRSLNQLIDLQLRPISQDLHQIRYWSALDNASEEKWDFQTRLPRAGGRQASRVYGDETDDDDFRGGDFDDYDGGTRRQPASRGFSWAAIAAICVLVLAIGLGGYFVYTKVVAPRFLSTPASGSTTQVQGYMVKLGNRELGIVVDKNKIEAYVTQLQADVGAQAGQTATIHQSIQYTPITVDSLFVANEDDVCNMISRHAAYDYLPPAPTPSQTPDSSGDASQAPADGEAGAPTATADGGAAE